MSHIKPDEDGNTLCRRAEASEILRAAGYPISPATLATIATRGDGPLFKRFGRIPLYRVSDLIAWAEKRSTPFAHSVTECNAARDTAA